MFADEGARICVADIDAVGAKSVAKEILEAGGEAFACAADSRSPRRSWRRAVRPSPAPPM
jgi:hypothetical protein